MRWVAFLAVGPGLVALGASSQPADAGAPDPIVVSVGDAKLRANELGFYLSRLNDFERESFGSTEDEVRRSLVERKLIPELLFAEQARSLGLVTRPDVAERVQKVLGDALKSRLQREADAKLTAKEIREYCKSSAAKSDAECARDHSSYRVVLRRTKAHAALTALTKELQKRDVRGVDHALLERITISPKGEISAAASPASEPHKPD
jgi:hypothetical protein